MADVMSLGHGGDGDEDPQSNPGPHEMDIIARKRTRGKAKNLALSKHVAKKGRMSFKLGSEATFTSVGTCNDALAREVGIYIWKNIALDKKGWKYVSPAEKNALHEHLRGSFNMDEIQWDVSDGIETMFRNRYKGRKHLAKVHFDKVGGYGDIERAKTITPEGMDPNNWLKVIEFFKSDAHKKRSTVNKAARKKQQFPNRGGTATYSSACYKESKTRMDQFQKAHTRKDGTCDDPLVEARYNEIPYECEAQSESQPTFESEEGFAPPNMVPISKVLGTQRRRISGIGHKPSSAGTSSFVEKEVPPPLTDAQYNQMFQDPRFRARMKELLKDPEFKNEDDTQEEDEYGDTNEYDTQKEDQYGDTNEYDTQEEDEYNPTDFNFDDHLLDDFMVLSK